MDNSLLLKIESLFEEDKAIGRKYFTSEEYVELAKATKQIITRAAASLTRQMSIDDKKIVFVTIIEIAKYWNNNNYFDEGIESGFWNFVFYYLEVIHNQQNRDLIYRIIRTLPISQAKTTKRYYATVLMHSYSPQKSLNSFFDLCYNIYIHDLEFNYTEEDKKLLKKISSRFIEIIQTGKIGDNDNLTLGTKVYSINIGIRQMAISMTNQFENFIDEILTVINSKFYNLKHVVEDDNYVTRKIDEWWPLRLNREIAKSPNIKRAVSQENITVSYRLEKKVVYIDIPPFRLDDNKDNDVKLKIMNNKEILKEGEIRTRQNDFIATTVPQQYRLDELLGTDDSINIEIEIYNKGKCIYNSKNKLIRNFLLFRDFNEITKVINPPSNYFIYSRNEKIIDEITNYFNDNITPIYDYLYNFYPQNGDIITISGNQFIFTDIKNSNINTPVYMVGNENNIEYFEDGKGYQVFTNSVRLFIRKETSIKGHELYLNSQRLLLTDLSNISEDDDLHVFDITTLIEQEVPTNLYIFSNKENKNILSINLILFQGLTTRFDTDLFYGSKTETIELDYNNQKSEKVFTTEDELTIDFHAGYLLLSIPRLQWRIDNKQWQKETNFTPLWYQEYLNNSSKLIISVSEAYDVNNVRVYYSLDENNTINEIIGSAGVYELGRLVYAIGKHKRINIFCTLNKKRYELLVISTKEHFFETPLVYLEKNLLWCPQNNYVGPTDARFSFSLKHGNKTEHLIEDLTSQDKIIEATSIAEEIYDLEVYRASDNPFLPEKTSLWKQSFMFGKREQFVFKNKKMYIEGVYCGMEKIIESDFAFKPLSVEYFIDNLTYIEEEGQGYYLGKLGIINKKGEIRYINNMENADGIREKTNPVRIELMSNRIFELVAGYDIETGDFIGTLYYDWGSERIHNNGKVFGVECVNAYKYRVR